MRETLKKQELRHAKNISWKTTPERRMAYCYEILRDRYTYNRSLQGLCA
jgi:hypothetical protein